MRIINALRRRLQDRSIARFMREVDEANLAFDARFGTDTAEEVALDQYDMDLGDEHEHGTWCYQGVQEAALRSIIESLVPNPEDFEFIDIGSGKGKAMLVASTYPFKRVRGVELSPRLHQTALANWSRFSECGLVQCQDVAFSCQDARKLDDLSGNVLVFLFNPLSPGPMREFVSRLETMVKAKDCSLMIAYLAPRAREAFEQAQELQQLLETSRLLVFGTSDLTLPDGAMPRLCARFDSWKT